MGTGRRESGTGRRKSGNKEARFRLKTQPLRCRGSSYTLRRMRLGPAGHEHCSWVGLSADRWLYRPELRAGACGF